MATIRNKLAEVCAAARVIVQRYGHTLKFAKHPVVLIIKQIGGFTDELFVRAFLSILDTLREELRNNQY
ncbi:MAG: hypothetical protein ACP5MC_02375 [Candidatus Micrarchaeia archaeon]